MKCQFCEKEMPSDAFNSHSVLECRASLLEQKTILKGNISALLERHSGVWKVGEDRKTVRKVCPCAVCKEAKCLTQSS